MSKLASEQTIITDDWTKNWQASIAVKITAVVMWVIIPFGFIIALFLVNSVENDLTESIQDDAEILLNSARILLSENNSYNSPKTTTELERKLEKSVFCKVQFSIAGSDPVTLFANECQQQTSVKDKTYYFTTLSGDELRELKLILSHRPVEKIMIKQRSDVIVLMVIIVIVLGLVLTWVIRLLVLKPLLKMVEETRLISEGKHDLRLNLNHHDEFGYLAKFLNKMLDQVFEQQTNLKQANLALMKEVAERNRITLELRANRDQLEKLVEERTDDLAHARDDALKANKAKSLFLANMSHEIRTPLNAILEYSQLLQSESGFTDKQLQSLKIIQHSGNQLLNLLNDILDISKIEAGKMELNCVNFDLNELLSGLALMFQERCIEKGLLWHDHNELSGHILVHSDPQKIRQVLINLLDNAVKFTNKGVISLQIKHIAMEQYVFEISDTGSGIVAEDYNNIYSAFHQNQTDISKEGTGLGLAIAKKNLELLGADMKLSSIVGEGSVFSFSLELKSVHKGVEIS